MKFRIFCVCIISLLPVTFLVSTAGAQSFLGSSSQDENIPGGSDVVNMAEGDVSPDSPFYTGPEQPNESQSEDAVKMQEATAEEQQFVDAAEENKVE